MNSHPLVGIEPPPDGRFKVLWQWIRRPEHSNAFTAIATVTYAVFTIILTVVSILQWREIQHSKADTQRLLSSLDKQARALSATAMAAEQQAQALTTQAAAASSQAVSSRDYATASRQNADAASESAHIAREAGNFSRASFQTSHRAYMIVEGSVLDSQPVADKPVNLTITFKNVGQTPALAVNARWHLYIIAVGTQMRPLPSEELPSLGMDTIGPNLTFSAHGTEGGFPSETVASLIGRKAILVARIIVVYKDIFGETHASEHCGSWADGSALGLRLGFCRAGLLDQARFF